MHKIVLALIFIFFAQLIVGVMSYSTFLQIPVFPNESLTWQAILEQFTTWVPVTIAFLYLFEVVVKLPPKEKQLLNERKLLIPSFFLLFITAFSIGAHAIASIVEDFLQGSTDTTLYSLVMVLDEFIGHIFLTSLPVLLFFIGILELNRKPTLLSKLEKVLVVILGLLNGLVWGIAGVEGGSMYLLVVPITLALTVYFVTIVRKHKLRLSDYPFIQYFSTSSIVMLVVTALWVLRFGWFTQPDHLGIELFNF